MRKGETTCGAIMRLKMGLVPACAACHSGSGWREQEPTDGGTAACSIKLDVVGEIRQWDILHFGELAFHRSLVYEQAWAVRVSGDHYPTVRTDSNAVISAGIRGCNSALGHVNVVVAAPDTT